MRRFKFGALALFAAVALYAVTASAASAFPHWKPTLSIWIIPPQTINSTWESTLGSLGGSLLSTEVEGETSPVSEEEGKETIKFLHTTSKITGIRHALCHTAGEGEGTVRAEGTYNMEEGTTGAALVLLTLSPEVQIICNSGSTPELTVKGSVLGVLTPTGKLTTKYYFEVKGSAGKPKTTKYKNENGEEKSALLYTETSLVDADSDLSESGPVLLETVETAELT